MRNEKLEKILSELQTGLSQILGDRLEAVYLYGSQARGDADPNSDIDVLIVLKEAFDYFAVQAQISDLAWRLSLENDVVIAQVLVSKEAYARVDSLFLMNVHREAVAL